MGKTVLFYVVLVCVVIFRNIISATNEEILYLHITGPFLRNDQFIS